MHFWALLVSTRRCVAALFETERGTVKQQCSSRPHVICGWRHWYLCTVQKGLCFSCWQGLLCSCFSPFKQFATLMFGQVTCPAFSSSSPVRPSSFLLSAKWLYSDVGLWHLLFNQSYTEWWQGRCSLWKFTPWFSPWSQRKAPKHLCMYRPLPTIWRPRGSVPLLKVRSGFMKCDGAD